MKKKVISKWRYYLGFAISFCLVALLAKQVDVDIIVNVLGKADWHWLLIAIVCYWSEIFFRIFRWKRLLVRMDSTITCSSIANSFCIGVATNNLLPLRVGDILRVHLVGVQRGLSRYSLIGTVVLEKLIDVIAILMLMSLSTLGQFDYFGVMPDIGFVVVFVLLCLLVVGGIYRVIGSKSLSHNWVILFHERLRHFKNGFSAILDSSNSLLILLDTLFIWSLNTLAIWAIVQSVGVSLSIWEILLLQGLVGLAAAIPSAPASIGTMQYAFLLTFGILNLDKMVGVAASLLVQGVLLGSITLVGVLIFAIDSESRKALGYIRHE